MKQLLFLLLFPCLALAQYQGNGNQKITLGEQTTADGLVWRGSISDTANLLTNKLDTSVYIVLDTGTRAMWYYRASTTPKWTRLVDSLNNLQGTLSVAKGGTGSATQNFVDLTTTQSVGGGKTFTSDIIAARFKPSATTASGTGIFTPTSTSLGFSTNGTNRMTLDATGNLAIGTTSPVAIGTGVTTLDIQGSISGGIVLGSSTTKNYIYGASTMFFEANTAIVFMTSTTEKLKITSTGNIGIGETTPTAVLHLKAGTATAAPIRLTSSGATLLSSLESGAIEFNGTNLLFTPSTTRHTVNHGLTGSATLDFLSTNAQNSRDMTIAVTGAADGDVVSLGVPNAAVNANTSYSAWVSAANTVTVRFNNYSSGTVDPASGTFKVFVTK